MSSLGRGLKSLIPENKIVEEGNSKRLDLIDIDKISPNPNQPRVIFDENSLQELSDSIKEYGVIEPIIIRSEKNKYFIIAGERRWRAAKLAGLEEIPAIIENLDEREHLQIALIENIQRENLNVIELARGYKQLIEEFNYTQEELAKVVGKNRSSITNILRLLKLPDEIQNMLLDNSISFGAARTLLTLDSEKEQLEIAKMIAESDLSVREIEKLIKKRKKSKKKNTKKTDPFLADIEERLSQRMDASVQISNRKNKGKIEIRYYSLDHLNSILELMGIEQEQL